MPDIAQIIVNDLSVIRKIAQRTQAQNPLAATIIAQARVIAAQAQALAEIDDWAMKSQRLAQQAAMPAAPADEAPANPPARPPVRLARRRPGAAPAAQEVASDG